MKSVLGAGEARLPAAPQRRRRSERHDDAFAVQHARVGTALGVSSLLLSGSTSHAAGGEARSRGVEPSRVEFAGPVVCSAPTTTRGHAAGLAGVSRGLRGLPFHAAPVYRLLANPADAGLRGSGVRTLAAEATVTDGPNDVARCCAPGQLFDHFR